MEFLMDLPPRRSRQRIPLQNLQQQQQQQQHFNEPKENAETTTDESMDEQASRRDMTGATPVAAGGGGGDTDSNFSFPGDYNKKPANSTFSYAFLLLVNTTPSSSPTTAASNGINITTTNSNAYYRGFLYNVLVAIYTLKESGSTADFVIYIRMPLTSSNSHAGVNNNKMLPWHEMEWLNQLGCRIIYLPEANEQEDFRQAQFLKFYILDLVEYERVLYLDADIMPLCNLDYIFRMSTTTTTTTAGSAEATTSIKENLVLAWVKEPANGGFFMLKPGIGELDALHRILGQQQQQQQGTKDQGGGFDKIQGWGHVIQKPDRWMAFQKKYVGKKWNFYAADGDQGLLYHWVKYYKQSVTLVYGINAEDWGHGNGTTLVREREYQPFANQSCMQLPPKKDKSRYAMHPAYGLVMQHRPPYSDFLHFYGPFKPWENMTLAMLSLQRLPSQMSKQDSESSLDYFFQQLRKVNHVLNMGLDFQVEYDQQNMSSHHAAALRDPKPWIQELQAPPLEKRRVPRKEKRVAQQAK